MSQEAAALESSHNHSSVRQSGSTVANLVSGLQVSAGASEDPGLEAAVCVCEHVSDIRCVSIHTVHTHSRFEKPEQKHGNTSELDSVRKTDLLDLFSVSEVNLLETHDVGCLSTSALLNLLKSI